MGCTPKRAQGQKRDPEEWQQPAMTQTALFAELATGHPSPLGLPETTDDFEHLRWFSYPDEVAAQT